MNTHLVHKLEGVSVFHLYPQNMRIPRDISHIHEKLSNCGSLCTFPQDKHSLCHWVEQNLPDSNIQHNMQQRVRSMQTQDKPFQIDTHCSLSSSLASGRGCTYLVHMGSGTMSLWGSSSLLDTVYSRYSLNKGVAIYVILKYVVLHS